MSEITFGTAICARLRVHWPAIECREEPVVTGGVVVLAHVADDLWLRLLSPHIEKAPWTAQPISVNEGRVVQIQSRYYGIGVREGASVEDVADRFYEEIRFWWSEYDELASP